MLTDPQYKKPKAPAPDWPTKEEGRKIETVPCPIHGTPLEVKREDGKDTAVCKCKVPGNPWLNRVVWERIDTRRSI
jgi:hypothetical protein